MSNDLYVLRAYELLFLYDVKDYVNILYLQHIVRKNNVLAQPRTFGDVINIFLVFLKLCYFCFVLLAYFEVYVIVLTSYSFI